MTPIAGGAVMIELQMSYVWAIRCFRPGYPAAPSVSSFRRLHWLLESSANYARYPTGATRFSARSQTRRARTFVRQLLPVNTHPDISAPILLTWLNPASYLAPYGATLPRLTLECPTKPLRRSASAFVVLTLATPHPAAATLRSRLFDSLAC